MDKWLPQYQAAWVGEIPAEFERIPTFHTTSLAQYGKQDEARPDREKFDCSIIIPVCNKVELTSQCLTHLAQVTHGCSYEVIVVDNGSSVPLSVDYLMTAPGRKRTSIFLDFRLNTDSLLINA